MKTPEIPKRLLTPRNNMRWKESCFAVAFCIALFAAPPAEAQGPPRPPTAPEIETLFQFQPGTLLTEENTTDIRRPELWSRRYANTDKSY